eukprot:3927909-Prorocentrum_lima.AAC.1
MPNIRSRKPTTTKRLFAVIGSALPLSSNLPSVLSVSTQRIGMKMLCLSAWILLLASGVNASAAP